MVDQASKDLGSKAFNIVQAIVQGVAFFFSGGQNSDGQIPDDKIRRKIRTKS